MDKPNIFLDTFNPDYYRYCLSSDTTKSKYFSETARQILLTAALIAEDWCIIPPSFLLEDSFNFELIKKHCDQLVKAKVIRFPSRGETIEELIERKREEYFAERLDFMYLYSKNTERSIALMEPAVLYRNTKIGQFIATGISKFSNQIPKNIQNILHTFSTKELDYLFSYPIILNADGRAVTPPAIIKSMGQQHSKGIIHIVEHFYGRAYIEEYNAFILEDVPYFSTHYGLETFIPLRRYSVICNILAKLSLSQQHLLAIGQEGVLILRQGVGFPILRHFISDLARNFNTTREVDQILGSKIANIQKSNKLRYKCQAIPQTAKEIEKFVRNVDRLLIDLFFENSNRTKGGKMKVKMKIESGGTGVVQEKGAPVTIENDNRQAIVHFAQMGQELQHLLKEIKTGQLIISEDEKTALENAEIATTTENEKLLESSLKTAGKWILETAKTVGLPILSSYVKSCLGLPLGI